MNLSTALLSRFFRLEGERLTLQGSVAGLWTITLIFGLGGFGVALLTAALALAGGPGTWLALWRLFAASAAVGAALLTHALLTRESWRIEIDRAAGRITAWRRGVEQPPEVLAGLEFAVGTPAGWGKKPRTYHLIAVLKSGRQIRLWQCPDPNIVQVMLAEITAWVERRD